MVKKAAALLLFVLVMCMTTALCESARVSTPGGKLNVRREADNKSRIAMYVPNGSIVDVEEEGGEWTKISYKGKSGYAKTDYLLLMRDMVGKTLYPDEGLVWVLEQPSGDADVAGFCPAWEPAEILAYESPWLKVRCPGPAGSGREGYAAAESFSKQSEERTQVPSFLTLRARTVRETALYRKLKETPVGMVGAGAELLVTQIDEDFCLAIGEKCGYIACSDIQILPPDEDACLVDSEAVSALETAETYLGKKYKNFLNQNLYGLVYRNGEWYACLFLSAQDQVKFAVLISEKGKAVMNAHYLQFAEPVREQLPEGHLKISVEKEPEHVGGVLHLNVESWTEQVRYTMNRDGEALFSTDWGSHMKASYRPREAGEYSLLIEARDENGLEKSESLSFTVTENTAPAEIAEVYSQHDGWWADKTYRKSNLEHSGCAIFALAHALNRMGFRGPETAPEELAKTYALCLTVDGTNNGRLIREASEAFGFSTEKDLINDKSRIRSMLEKGDLFSFSICRSHIAMVSGLSGDGKMVRVVDSAPTATFERIRNAQMYRETRGGGYMPVGSLDDFPESRWYMEMDAYGGLEYYLTLDYVAKRGVRLIRPAEE